MKPTIVDLKRILGLKVPVTLFLIVCSGLAVVGGLAISSARELARTADELLEQREPPFLLTLAAPQTSAADLSSQAAPEDDLQMLHEEFDL